MKRNLRLTADQQLLIEENTNIVHWDDSAPHPPEPPGLRFGIR